MSFNKTVLASALALIVTGAACSSNTSPAAPSGSASLGASDAQLEGRSSLPTIAGVAVGNPNFTTLVAALSKAGLAGTFDGNVHYTVFAPTNAAFDAAAQQLIGQPNGMALVSALDVPTLTAVLKYHVTRGDRNSTSVVSAGSLRMLDGNSATVSVAGGVARINSAMITATDIRASNGIVHVIGGVLLPPTQ